MAKTGDDVRVFICDDETIVRQALTLQLMDVEGVRVVGDAGTPETCIREIRRLAPAVCIVDLRMRYTSDGLRVCHAVRALAPAPHVICYSAFFDRISIHELLRIGVAGFVDKGEAVTEVTKAVLRVAEGTRVVSPNLVDVIPMTEASAGVPSGEAAVRLSLRQRQTLELLAEGYAAGEVASWLGVSENSVRTHRRRLCDKFNVTKTTELVAVARRLGLLA